MLCVLAALFLLAPSPDTIRAQERLKHGQELMTSERFEEAADAFREAIALDPLLTMAHYGLGQAHMALKQYPAAVTAYTGARQAFDKNVAANLDQRLENEGKREDRIRSLRDRIRENQDRMLPPNSPAARQRDMRVQQWEMEIASLQRSHGGATIPETPPFLSLALGSAHFRSGQMADAEREYRAALKVQPRLGEPRNNLAVVLLLTGRAAEAREELRIAEKNGFKPAPGLLRDIEAALAKSTSPTTRP